MICEASDAIIHTILEILKSIHTSHSTRQTGSKSCQLQTKAANETSLKTFPTSSLPNLFKSDKTGFIVCFNFLTPFFFNLQFYTLQVFFCNLGISQMSIPIPLQDIISGYISLQSYLLPLF